MRKCLTTAGFLLLLVTACGGDTGGAVGSDEPPWGLDQIDLPNTEEEVAAVFAAFPDEIEGLSRSGGMPSGVMYEPTSPGMPWSVMGLSSEQFEAYSTPVNKIETAEDWLRFMGSDRMLGASDWERALTGDLLWVANSAPMEVGPGEMGTVYLLHWAQTDGTWAFTIQATSETGRLALVEAFIAATG